jgi:hypothetical protein
MRFVMRDRLRTRDRIGGEVIWWGVTARRDDSMLLLHCPLLAWSVPVTDIATETQDRSMSFADIQTRATMLRGIAE